MVRSPQARRRTLRLPVLPLLVLGVACAPASRDEGATRVPDTAGTASRRDTADTSTLPAPSLAGVMPALPTDEAAREPALRATRDTLLAIVRRRDTVALAAYLDPAVKYSFGDNDGRAGFFAHWRQSESLPALWATLEDVLTHGGRFTTPTLFSAPWTFTALPDSLDAFTHVIVRERSVPVYASPSETGAPLGTVGHTVLAIRGAPDGAWWPVTLPDGRTAFVDTMRVRSPIGYRLGLAKQGARWVIQYFVAGD